MPWSCPGSGRPFKPSTRHVPARPSSRRRTARAGDHHVPARQKARELCNRTPRRVRSRARACACACSISSRRARTGSSTARSCSSAVARRRGRRTSRRQSSPPARTATVAQRPVVALATRRFLAQLQGDGGSRPVRTVVCACNKPPGWSARRATSSAPMARRQMGETAGLDSAGPKETNGKGTARKMALSRVAPPADQTECQATKPLKWTLAPGARRAARRRCKAGQRPAGIDTERHAPSGPPC